MPAETGVAIGTAAVREKLLCSIGTAAVRKKLLFSIGTAAAKYSWFLLLFLHLDSIYFQYYVYVDTNITKLWCLLPELWPQKDEVKKWIVATDVVNK